MVLEGDYTGPAGAWRVLREPGLDVAVLETARGGILLRGDLVATPATNAGFLALGGVLASFVGTTGASMLLSPPVTFCA